MKPYQRYALAIVSGILLAVSHPGLSFFPLAWIGLVPLLIAVKSASNSKSAFCIGYTAGLTFFSILLYWIVLLYPYANIFLTALGYVALVAYVALYFAIFAVFAHRPLCQKRTTVIFSLALLWTGLEWIRSWLLTGFPWGSMGYTQWKYLPAIQIASICGVHGVSFIVVLFNVTLADFIVHSARLRIKLKATVLPISMVLICLSYGFFCLSHSKNPTPRVKLALIPGNVSQLDKWQYNEIPKIFNDYIDLTKKADATNPDLIVWPETALHSLILSAAENQYKPRLLEMLKKHEIYLLTGAPVQELDTKFYNSAFILSPSGEKLGSYSKIHLVPFGEYVPLSPLLPNIIQFEAFEPGKTINLIPLANIKNAQVGISICFESAFPNLFRKFVKKGANLMGILTNDAWFEGTTAPSQHLAVAPFRAVENRIAVFRCANGGISCIIDGFGRITQGQIMPTQSDEILVEEAPLTYHESTGTTLYTRYGDWFPILCFLISLVLIVHRYRGGFPRNSIDTQLSRKVSQVKVHPQKQSKLSPGGLQLGRSPKR